jgi:hypothetical protein
MSGGKMLLTVVCAGQGVQVLLRRCAVVGLQLKQVAHAVFEAIVVLLADVVWLSLVVEEVEAEAFGAG